MNGARDGTRLGLRRFAPLFAALFAVAALPVLLCDTLPLFDYPNHLARMHILASLAHSAPLQRYYAIDWRPVPNLALDVLVPPLLPLMPLAWAGKVFILGAMLLLAGGAAMVHRVLYGSWSAWPCLAFLLLYSRTLLWGFLNYLFGIGLGLFALALWLALARRGAGLRVAVGALMALLLFFAHLLACGLYGVVVMSHAAGVAWRRRGAVRTAFGELFVAGLPFLPPLAILLLLTPGGAGGAIAWANPLRKIDLLFSVFDNYSRPFDIACFVLAAGAVVLALWRRWVRIEPSMLLPLFALALTYLAMPSRLASASGADHRIPLLFDLLLLASSRWTVPRPGLQRLFLGGALLMFLLRMGVVGVSWAASERAYARLLPALDALPWGGRLAVAFPSAAVNSQATPLVHFPTLAVVRRDAFVPTLFAFPTQQPLRLTPRYRALAAALPPERLWQAFVGGGAPLDAGERALLKRYDHIVFVSRASFAVRAGSPLAPQFVAPRFALFAIRGGALDEPGRPR
jgi:hypothetical protein